MPEFKATAIKDGCGGDLTITVFDVEGDIEGNPRAEVFCFSHGASVDVDLCANNGEFCAVVPDADDEFKFVEVYVKFVDLEFEIKKEPPITGCDE